MPMATTLGGLNRQVGVKKGCETCIGSLGSFVSHSKVHLGLLLYLLGSQGMLALVLSYNSIPIHPTVVYYQHYYHFRLDHGLYKAGYGKCVLLSLPPLSRIVREQPRPSMPVVTSFQVMVLHALV